MLPNINQAKNYQLLKIWSGGPDGMPSIIVNKYCKPYTLRCLLHEHINNTFENLVHLTVKNTASNIPVDACYMNTSIILLKIWSGGPDGMPSIIVNKYCKPYTLRCLLHEHINNTFENLVHLTVKNTASNIPVDACYMNTSIILLKIWST